MTDRENDPDPADADLTDYPSDEEIVEACDEGLRLAQTWAELAGMKPAAVYDRRSGSLRVPIWWNEPWKEGKQLSEKMRDADDADLICERRRTDAIDGAARVEETAAERPPSTRQARSQRTRRSSRTRVAPSSTRPNPPAKPKPTTTPKTTRTF